MIEFQHVVKQYADGTLAVDDLNMTCPTGKITILVGPSGCGKTTSLKMINRLIEPTSGSILIDGEDTTHADLIQMRRNIGYVIQNAGLFPNKTVIDNICTVPFLKGVNKVEAYTRAIELLELVGLDEKYAKRYPWQLSGGQRQRVGIARALSGNPTCMLMDEPFSAVDPIVRKVLQDEFLRIQKTMAKTIVMVTHDISEALKLGDYVAVFQDGGKLVQFDTPANLLAHPANEFVSSLLGVGRGYERLRFANPNMPTREVKTIKLGEPVPFSKTESWYVAVDENNYPLGWIPAEGGPCEPERIFYAPILEENQSNMKEVLDAVLSSPAKMAIVYNPAGPSCHAIEAANVLEFLANDL